MKLPQDLQPHFLHLALLILSDSITAKFYLIGGDAIEELDGICEPRENRQDSQGSTTSYDGSRVGGRADSNIDDEPRLNIFVNKIVDRATDLLASNDIAHLHLVMPAELEHKFSTELPSEHKEKILHIIHRNLMKEDLLSVLRRIYPSE